MDGWHHQLDRHESEQTLEDGKGQMVVSHDLVTELQQASVYS